MAGIAMNELNWTDDQRGQMETALADEIENSRLAHKFIPEYDLSPTDRAVRRDKFDYVNGTIDETHQDLQEPIEPFFLTQLQTQDANLANARLRVRQAARQLAKDHDAAVFQRTIHDEIIANQGIKGYHDLIRIRQPFPDGLVTAAADAVAALDAEGHRSGYVMVGGQGVYGQLHTRAPGAADLPVKAVEGLLDGGPIYRSAVLPADEALVLSLTGEEVDRAVAVPPTLEFLRVGAGENREFRLYERFLTRFRQTLSVVVLQFEPAPAPKTR
jgi:hypothetical protein